VVRGFLGFTGDDLTRELAPGFDLNEDQRGTLILEVVEDSPADNAGLMPGDIITHLDGREMETFRELRFAIADVRPGTGITLTVLRDGEKMEIDATVGSRDGEPLAGDAADNADEGALVGVGVSNIDPQSRRQYGIPSRVQGALVTQVDPDSAAAAVGLRPGHVIVEINRERVRNAEDAIELTETRAENGRTLLRIWSARFGYRFVLVDESDD
jgi:serine protease Do